jgi:S-adenosylmethionine:tRNA ribosyltransferase-isomerase
MDRRWYQTVYADPGAPGSVAAPTAGLHFTDSLLAGISALGCRRADVRLHVGAGTFKPIETQFVEEHPIHEEWLEAPARAVAELEAARARRGRVFAVGTTSVRAIESLPEPLHPRIRSDGYRGATRLMISPGYSFCWTDALLTNFHLPRSTLLALVAALLPEGIERLIEIYAEAVAERYRFYSYGDAMLVLP